MINNVVETIDELVEENQKLKDLLKVIRGYLVNGCDVEDEIRICEEIDEVLK